MPYVLSGHARFASNPDPEECRARVRAVIEARLKDVREEADRLCTEIDDPNRAEAPDRATLLTDPEEARLFLRYHAEARTSFHRHMTALTKAIKEERDAEAGGPVGAVSPSEANRAVEPVVTCEAIKGSEIVVGQDSDPDSSTSQKS